MPQPKYRYRNVERADNTAQIGIRNNRRAIETVENRYRQARSRKAKGTATFKDNRLLDYRNPKSLYTQMRKGSGAVRSVHPEFDILTLRGTGIGNAIDKAGYNVASKAGNKIASKGVDLGLKVAKPILTSKRILPITKRAAEVVMRTQANANPIPYMKIMYKNMLKGSDGGKDRLFDIANYVLRGKRNGAQGWYNSLAAMRGDKVNYYGGFGDFGIDLGTDYIDAFLYGKTIDPKYGLKKITTPKDYDGWLDYINTFYPNKKNKIITYETVPNSNPYGWKLQYPTENNLVNAPKEYITLDGYGGFRIPSDAYSVNAAGHNVDINKALGIVRQRDIWKFLPKDYKPKWGIRGKLADFGLNVIDEIGTPIITKTPWFKPKYIYYRSPKEISLKYGGIINK